jgi:polysaccharide pyruvyl transferase CsaB
VYYLGVMRAATWRNVPVAVVGQGIGPIRRPWVQSLATRVFADARTISVRDAGSAGLLASMGVTREIHLGADLALLAPVDSSERIQARIAAEGLDLGRVRIGMAVRAWPGMRDIGELGRGIGRFAEMVGGRIAVFPFDRAQDLEVSEAVAAAAQGRVIAAETPAELLGLIGTMDVMVAVRLHGLVFAAAQGVPAVGVAYDPKVTAFMAELGLPGVLPLDATGLALAEALARAWHGRIALRSRVRAALPRLQARATEGIERVVRLLAEPLRE